MIRPMSDLIASQTSTIGGGRMGLEQELQVYRLHLIDMLGVNDANEGKYTAIKGSEIIGPFADYESALDAAYKRFGIGGFLVKKIEREETVLHFSRDLR
jgi:hypothetical protein